MFYDEQLKNKKGLNMRPALLLVTIIFCIEIIISLIAMQISLPANHVVHALLGGIVTAIVAIPLTYILVVNPMKKSLIEIEGLSNTDHLTGVYNRRGFTTLAKQQVKYSIRTNQKLELFFIDIDNLKTINDTLGHKEGDAAIILAARILEKVFRASDIIARLGGDEFVTLTIGKKIEIKRIMSRIEKYGDVDGLPFKLSMSIGVASFDPKNPCSIDELISHADSLMYKQKEKKKKYL